MSMSDTEIPSTQWNNIAYALSIGLLTASVNPNLSLYLYERFRVDPITLSWLLGLNSIAGLVFTLIIPGISDRISDLRGMLCAVNCAAFSGLATIPFVSDPQTLGLLFVLLLGPYSALSSLFFTYIRRTHSNPSLVVKLRSLYSVAWVVGPAAATTAMTSFGLSSIFWIAAVLCLANSMFIWWMPSSNPTSPRAKRDSSQNGKVTVLLMFAGFVLLLGTNYITGNVVSLLLRDEFHSTLFQIGLVASLAAAIEIPLFFLLPIVAERRGRAFVFKIGCLAGLLYCVGLSASQNYLQVLLLQALNAVFVASVIGMGLAWFQEIHPAKIGFMTGLFSNASRLSALVAAPVIGMSTLYFASYRGPILVAAIMVLAGGLILLPIAADRKPHAR